MAVSAPAGGLPVLRLGLYLAGAIFAIDRTAKWWILDIYDLPSRGVVKITPFLSLTMAWNRGISFSLFANDSDWGRWVLIGVTFAVVGVLVFWLARARGAWIVSGLGLVIGGALGNILDRLVYGAVADFVHLHAGAYSWPVFNVADMAISTGVAFLLLDTMILSRRRQSAEGGT